MRQLWMFMVVAEEQHFGRAAARLGMSQPPLSEQIQVLEKALKVRLFDRSRRGTKLSSAGAAILPAVRLFVSQMEQLGTVVREVASGHSGVLRIGSITSAMLETLPPLLDDLRQAYPSVTASVKEIDSVEAIPALEAGELDFALVRLEGDVGEKIAIMPLAEDFLAVALPIGHQFANQEKVQLRSIGAEPLVMSSRQVSPVYFDMLTSVCRQHGVAPRILHEVRSVTSQLAYVSCGQGIALVPLSMHKLAPANVVVRPLEEKINVVTAALAWNPARHHPLVDFVVSSLKARAAQ